MAEEMMMDYVPSTEDIVRAYYHEMPDRAAAIAAAVLYGAISCALVVNTVRTRAWWMFVAVVTGVLEIVGFALRVEMLSKPEFMTYVVSYALLVIAPVFLVIAMYLCVGKLIARSKDSAKGSSTFAKLVSIFMIVSELACLGLQCASGGFLTSEDAAMRETGRKMMLAGLAMQLGFFTIFAVITVFVHCSPRFGYKSSSRFAPLFWSLYASIVMFYIRNVFRVVEFAEGFTGYLATNERFFYGFDFALVFAILMVFTVFHYGFYLGPVADAKQQEAEAAERNKAGTSGPQQEFPAIEVVALE